MSRISAHLLCYYVWLFFQLLSYEYNIYTANAIRNQSEKSIQELILQRNTKHTYQTFKLTHSSKWYISNISW